MMYTCKRSSLNLSLDQVQVCRCSHWDGQLAVLWRVAAAGRQQLEQSAVRHTQLCLACTASAWDGTAPKGVCFHCLFGLTAAACSVDGCPAAASHMSCAWLCCAPFGGCGSRPSRLPILPVPHTQLQHLSTNRCASHS